MTNEYETIKEWVGNNFMFNLPYAIYNLDACLRSRLHVTFKGVSGIYIIRNLITDKVYIGSTKNIMKRISEHLYMLEQGTHHSTKLQNSTNKYLYKNFEVRIYPCWARSVQKNIKERLERLSQSRTLEKGTLIRN